VRATWRDERGQAVPLAAALVGLAVVVTIALGGLAGDVVDAGRARTAADAAALAGVEGGRGAAARLAAANGGSLVSWSQQGDAVTVTVRVGDAVATAGATR
jgi:hypothetical protein